MAGEQRSSAQAIAGVAQLVERKPSKLDVAGSSPVSRFSGNRDQGTGNRDSTRRQAPARLDTREIIRFPVPWPQFPVLLA